MQKLKKIIGRAFLVLIAGYLLLLIPVNKNTAIIKSADKPFAWNQDSIWQVLEQRFVVAKQQNDSFADAAVIALFMQQNTLYDSIAAYQRPANDSIFSGVLNNYFQLAAMIAAHPKQRDAFISCFSSMRNLVKQQSVHWNMNDKTVRDQLYRLLYGMRAAAEEVLLQTDRIPFKPAVMVKVEPSATPATTIFGIKVHSGDMLVSRGGAEVSAFISRGNNYPGNFSHVALLYVDEKTNEPYLVEAHIEKGVAVSSAAQYVKDKKLRFMVLRPRADLPQLIADPLLPHKAAKLAYDDALSRHIPYDFKMDFHDSTALFCSEVASHAYQLMGVQLWQAESTISSQGIVNWSADFGVEHFVTQMPSDLEYDPQLSVVAEWRDPETLMKDHLDNAVMDALLEEAEKGRTIGYNTWQLPMVRVIKLYCLIKNWFGGIGIIPEGMSATTALKNQRFVSMYKEVKTETSLAADQFIKENGYRPPYWQLVAMAKKVAGKLE